MKCAITRAFAIVTQFLTHFLSGLARLIASRDSLFSLLTGPRQSVGWLPAVARDYFSFVARAVPLSPVHIFFKIKF